MFDKKSRICVAATLSDITMYFSLFTLLFFNIRPNTTLLCACLPPTRNLELCLPHSFLGNRPFISANVPCMPHPNPLEPFLHLRIHCTVSQIKNTCLISRSFNSAVFPTSNFTILPNFPLVSFASEFYERRYDSGGQYMLYMEVLNFSHELVKS